MGTKTVIKIFIIIVNLVFLIQIPEAKEGKMNLTSPEFTQNEMIPKKFTCQGEDISPTLEITGVPERAASLVLINDDPDAPGGTWDHWIVFNIAPTEIIDEDSVPGIQGKNSWGRNEYGGPCPPSGTHRYFFKLYALDSQLNLSEGATKQEVEAAMKDFILDQATLVGVYKKE